MKRVPARLWLFPAREAPIVLIARRQPHRWWHFLWWNTDTDEIIPGAWHDWLFYPEYTDISPDGKHLTAMLGWGYGRGIATVPDLVPSQWWSDGGSYGQAGAFIDGHRVSFDLWNVHEELVNDPQWKVFRSTANVMQFRLERDGWRGVAGRWRCQPTPEHPVLEAIEVGHRGKTAYGFEFKLEGLPDLSWAWYDAQGQLLAARKGLIERYTLADLKSGRCSFRSDLNSSAPPEVSTTRGTIPDMRI